MIILYTLAQQELRLHYIIMGNITMTLHISKSTSIDSCNIIFTGNERGNGTINF